MFISDIYLLDLPRTMLKAELMIRISPDYIYTYYNLGLFYSLSNDRDSALEQYKILKKLDTGVANELFNVIYE